MPKNLHQNEVIGNMSQYGPNSPMHCASCASASGSVGKGWTSSETGCEGDVRVQRKVQALNS